MKRLPVLAVVALGLSLAGCAAPAASGDVVSVVASTDVWASVAQAVGGDRIGVTAIIDSPDKDPHEYEATARDQLAVSRADLVIENGGGYDPFMDTLLEASGAEPALIDAVAVSDLAPPEDAEEHSDDAHQHVEGFNEHVWYDLGTVAAVAARVEDELGRIDPAGADAYSAGRKRFQEALDRIQARLDEVRTQGEGRKVLVTEPVPLWLLTGAGFVDATPPAFSEAVEEGTDVAPGILQDVLGALSEDDIALLAYNEQAETAQTEHVREAAEAAAIPVVDFAETLPENEDYAGWMEANVERVAAALTG